MCHLSFHITNRRETGWEIGLGGVTFQKLKNNILKKIILNKMHLKIFEHWHKFLENTNKDYFFEKVK